MRPTPPWPCSCGWPAGDAARGALRSAEQLLATAAAAGAGTAVAATITAERVTLLTLVGRTADALALGRVHLDAVRGDDHAELCLQLARTAVPAAAWADVETYVGRAGRPTTRGRLSCAPTPHSVRVGWPRRPAGGGRDRRAEQVADEHGSDVAAAALCEALGVAGRLAWRTDLDRTEALARRAAQVAGEHGLLPWRVTALFQLGMMRMLRAGDMAPMLQSRELALDAGMLATSRRSTTSTPTTSGSSTARVRRCPPRAPRTTWSACCARPGMPSARGRGRGARRAQPAGLGPGHGGAARAGPRPSRRSRAAGRGWSSCCSP